MEHLLGFTFSLDEVYKTHQEVELRIQNTSVCFPIVIVNTAQKCFLLGQLQRLSNPVFHLQNKKVDGVISKWALTLCVLSE